MIIVCWCDYSQTMPVECSIDKRVIGHLCVDICVRIYFIAHDKSTNYCI